MLLIRGQGCLFLSCFSKHRKASTLTTHGDIHTWLLQQAAALCAVAGNRSLAILFSSTWQICHLPDGSKGRSVGHQPAVIFCKKSMAWWPPRTRAVMWVQWPHITTVPSQQDSCTEFFLGQPLPQKAFAASWEEEPILTSFHSFLAQMGLIVLHITFCSRTTTVHKGKSASALYSHAQSWTKNSGICFLSEQHRVLKPLCDTQQRLGSAAPEYTQGPSHNLCD